MTLDAFEASLVVQAMACSARVEGMRAENAHRESCGNGPAYGEEAFNAEAVTLEHLAACLRERGNR